MSIANPERLSTSLTDRPTMTASPSCSRPASPSCGRSRCLRPVLRHWLHGVATGAMAIAASLAIAAPAGAAITETVTYYHADAGGTPVAATDAAGAVLWRQVYLPYGGRDYPALKAGDEPTAFTGKRIDEHTGLQYFGARDYDPALGRFTSIDPVGFHTGNVQMFNRYAYANNNPYRFIDPDGRLGIDLNKTLMHAPLFPQLAVNFGGGFGDGVTLGVTAGIRHVANIDGGIDTDSTAYALGDLASNAVPGKAAAGAVRAGARNAGAMQRRTFEPASYHGSRQSGRKSRGPTNPQDALDNSVQVGENSTRRVGIDPGTGEFSVFDQHAAGRFHGHVRSWSELSNAQRSALQKQLGVGRRGQLPEGYRQ